MISEVKCGQTVTYEPLEVPKCQAGSSRRCPAWTRCENGIRESLWSVKYWTLPQPAVKRSINDTL